VTHYKGPLWPLDYIKLGISRPAEYKLLKMDLYHGVSKLVVVTLQRSVLLNSVRSVTSPFVVEAAEERKWAFMPDIGGVGAVQHDCSAGTEDSRINGTSLA